MKTKNNKPMGNGHKPTELVMQASLELLPLIMNNIPQAVFWKDRDLVYLGCNQAFADDAGFSSPEDIVGKTDFDMPWKAQAELYRADDSAVMEKGEPKLNYEEPQTTPGGSTIWLSTSKIPVRENGQVVAVLGMYEDVTARKQVEQTLRESEERYSAVVNQANDGVTIIQDNICRFANKNLADMLGYTPEEVRDTPFINYVAPESRALIAARVKARLAGEDVPPVYEARLQRKDGTIIDAELSAGVIQYQGKSADVGLIRDITARKQAEEAVHESEQRYQTIFNASPVMFWLKDTKNNMIQINEAAAAFENVKPEDLNGRSSYDVYPREQAEAFYQDDLQVIRSGKPKLGIIEKHTSPGTGKATWLETGKVPVQDEKGMVTGVLAFAVDITERQEVEKALQESEDRFRRFTEATVEGLVFHEQGKIIDANPAALAMYRLTDNNEFIGRNLLEFITPEAHPLVLKQMQLETVLPYEIQCFRSDGTTFPVETSTRIYKTGERVIRASSIRDITERKQAEQKLQENQQLLQLVMDNIPQSVFWKDKENLSYLGVNQAFAEDAGFTSPQEIVGRNDFDMPWKEQAELYRADDRRVLDLGEAKLNYEEPQTGPTGNVTWLRTSKIPMRDANGQVFAVLGMYEDITEQKQLQQQVQEAFERRGYQVQVSTEISQEIAAATEINDLFDRVVTLTKERLGYYHTQLLRYDPAQDAVVLMNGYGETGQKMLAGGHKMPMGEGLIGTAAATGETVLRPSLADDPDWHPNPLLPDTRGEIAVPIKLKDQILGVLDVQSDQAGALTEDDRLLLEGLCGQIAVAIDQTRLRQEMTERLEEINRLYHSMSQEGWRTYRETADLPTGFMFDQTNVKPVEDVVLTDESFTSVPMKVLGGETVGNLAVANDPRRPMSQEDIDFLEQVSDQVALALEGARLAAQTESARAQSEKLFEASRVLTQSADLQELTATTVSMLDIPAINRAILTTFNYNAQDNIESLDIVANWWNGTGHEITAVGTHYPYDVIRAMSFFISPTPVFFDDTHTDERVDATTMKLVERLNLRAVAVLPLYAGTRQIGALILEAEEPHNFSQEETRLFTALAPQISTMLENRRQFERAQQQAEREGLLNIISQKIQSATTVEAVLQIAARELGHALGAPMTIAQLSMKDKK